MSCPTISDINTVVDNSATSDKLVDDNRSDNSIVVDDNSIGKNTSLIIIKFIIM